MSRRLPWKLAAAGGIAGAAILGSAMGLAGLSGGVGPLGFSEAHDRRAFTLLVGSSDPAVLDAAAAEAREAIRLAPYNNSARLRLTYIDTVRRGRVGPEGMAALAESYTLVPLDHTVAAWRVRFALEHWREVTPEIRAAAQAEAMAFGQTGSQDANLQAALQSIQSPEGRLAAALWLRALAR